MKIYHAPAVGLSTENGGEIFLPARVGGIALFEIARGVVMAFIAA